MPLIDKSFFIDLDLSGYDACKAQFLRYASKNMLFSDFIRSIEKFSELGDFLSTPISTYSAGMKTRLMFALITSFSHPNYLQWMRVLQQEIVFLLKRQLKDLRRFLHLHQP